MASKTFQIAHLAALLSTHTKKSAHTCAELAVKLHGIGGAVSAVQTWECNGYKNEYIDKHINKLSRENPSAANDYVKKVNDDGRAYCEKHSAQLENKLAVIRKDTGLDLKQAGLSGVCWYIGDSQEYYI